MKLREGLNRCNRIVAKKSKMPALLNVLIEPTEAGICITATDLEMFYQVDVEGVTTSDTFTAPLKQLRDIVGKKDVKEITWGPGNMITVGAAKFFGLPKEEFPLFPLKEINLEDYKEVKLNNLPWVSVAQSTDETRCNLNGVYLDTKAGNMVATNGHRLHMTKIDPIEDVKPVTIPRPAVTFLNSIKAGSVFIDAYVCPECKGTKIMPFKKLNADSKASVKKAYEDCEGHFADPAKPPTTEEFYNDHMHSHLHVKCQHCKDRVPHILYISDDEVFTSRPVDGDFPDYFQVLPQKKSINFQLKTTSEALKAAIVQTDGIRPKSNGIKFTLGNACHLSASNPDAGEVDVEFKGKFKKLLKPIDNPCEGCKDKRISLCSIRETCEEYTAYDSSKDSRDKYPCDACTKKQGECDISQCDRLNTFRLSTLKEFSIGVNARYLSEALFGEDVTWGFSSETAQTWLTFGGEEMALIMPCKL